MKLGVEKDKKDKHEKAPFTAEEFAVGGILFVGVLTVFAGLVFGGNIIIYFGEVFRNVLH